MVAVAATVLFALNVVGSALLAGLIAIALTKTVATWVHPPSPFVLCVAFVLYVALHRTSFPFSGFVHDLPEARTSPLTSQLPFFSAGCRVGWLAALSVRPPPSSFRSASASPSPPPTLPPPSTRPCGSPPSACTLHSQHSIRSTHSPEFLSSDSWRQRSW